MTMKRIECEGVGDNDGFFECNAPSESTFNGLLCEPNNELGVRLLDFLRDINEQEETPESNDVDDLLSLISQYVETTKA